MLSGTRKGKKGKKIGILNIATLVFFLAVLLYGCSEKPPPAPDVLEDPKDSPPVLKQNFLYKTNRSKPVRRKDVAFQESSDDFETASEDRSFETLSD